MVVPIAGPEGLCNAAHVVLVGGFGSPALREGSMEESYLHCRGLRWRPKTSAFKNLYCLSFPLESIGESVAAPTPIACVRAG